MTTEQIIEHLGTVGQGPDAASASALRLAEAIIALAYRTDAIDRQLTERLDGIERSLIEINQDIARL